MNRDHTTTIRDIMMRLHALAASATDPRARYQAPLALCALLVAVISFITWSPSTGLFNTNHRLCRNLVISFVT